MLEALINTFAQIEDPRCDWRVEHKLLDKPVFGNLEKPRVGRRDRVPTPAETEAILAKASPAFSPNRLAPGSTSGTSARSRKRSPTAGCR